MLRARPRQWLLLLSSLASVVLFTVATVPAAVRQTLSSHQSLSWLVTVAVYAALPLRRRFPVVTVAVATVGSVVLTADGMVYPLTLLAVYVALYQVALESSQGRALAVGIPVKLTLLAASMFTRPGSFTDPGISGVFVVLWATLAVTTGCAARSHRAYVAEAEQAREDEANRRVTEERLRIARELHDAVGHHVALINVQAGALACLLDDGEREQAGESVTHIQRAGAEALDELRMTVGLLRQPGASEQPQPHEPVPGLDRLGGLFRAFAGSGLRVTREVTGQTRPLPEAVELTAYRVIQESLTNTRKHAGSDTAVVRLGYAPGALTLAVEDDGDGISAAIDRRQVHPPGGHGLMGMRERVAALGGRLAVGPRPEGGYHVTAELPLTLRHVTGGEVR